MNYLYFCPGCDEDKEIKKPMARSGEKENCPDCGRRMKRRFSSLSVTWGKNCWDYDNQGLGDNLVLRHHD